MFFRPSWLEYAVDVAFISLLLLKLVKLDLGVECAEY